MSSKTNNLIFLQPVKSMLARIRPPAHLQRGDGGGQPLSQDGQTFTQGGQHLSQGGDSPEEWRKAPALTQGPSKKYPHLSKAVEVGHSLSFFLIKQPFILLSPILPLITCCLFPVILSLLTLLLLLYLLSSSSCSFT